MADLSFTIKKGYVWAGLTLTCYSDTAKTIHSNLAGCTASMKMKHKTKDVEYSFTCNVSTPTITVAKISAANTANLTLGEYDAELAITWPSGDKMGPYATIAFSVVGGIN